MSIFESRVIMKIKGSLLTGSQEVVGSNPIFSTSVTASLLIRKAHH